jgi:hypothetical protein
MKCRPPLVSMTGGHGGAGAERYLLPDAAGVGATAMFLKISLV